MVKWNRAERKYVCKRPNLKKCYRLYQHIEACNTHLELFKLIKRKSYIPADGIEWTRFDNYCYDLEFDDELKRFKLMNFAQGHYQDIYPELSEVKNIYQDFIVYWYFTKANQKGFNVVNQNSYQLIKKLHEIYD